MEIDNQVPPEGAGNAASVSELGQKSVNNVTELVDVMKIFMAEQTKCHQALMAEMSRRPAPAEGQGQGPCSGPEIWWGAEGSRLSTGACSGGQRGRTGRISRSKVFLLQAVRAL
jgi:hypothetical protein